MSRKSSPLRVTRVAPEVIACAAIIIASLSRFATKHEAGLDPRSWNRYPLMLLSVFLPMLPKKPGCGGPFAPSSVL